MQEESSTQSALFQEQLLCGTDSSMIVSLNSSTLTSSSQGLIATYHPYPYNFHFLLSLSPFIDIVHLIHHYYFDCKLV